jgi:hypothetical protein
MSSLASLPSKARTAETLRLAAIGGAVFVAMGLPGTGQVVASARPVPGGAAWALIIPDLISLGPSNKT